MKGLYDKIEEAKAFIRTKTALVPEFGVILGTGLGGLADHLHDRVDVPYEEIPGFLPPSLEHHAGFLAMGTMDGRGVMLMEGRVHVYEGHSMQEVTFPVRVMKALGVKVMIATAAVGGLNPQFTKGDLMVVDDHINLMGMNPLVGPNDERLGPRYPDMIEPYDKELIELVEVIALEQAIKLQKGVYVALTGPCLETRAEYRFLRTIGADVVGMSTVPEVIVGVHAGLRNMGLVVITDECFPDALKPVDIDEIIATANAAAPKLETLILQVIERAET